MVSKWFLRKEDPDHGFNYSYMTVELVPHENHTPTVNFVEEFEKKTYLVEAAREIWDALINDDWNVYIPEEEKSEVAPQPKERLRRKKQRVKTAMTGFDKLKKKQLIHELHISNYALEA